MIVYVLMGILALLGSCERQDPPVDVKALEEPETGPRGDIIQDD